MNLKNYIRNFKDFPKKGILFRDICPILKSPEAMKYIIDQICDYFKEKEFNLIGGAESRGLIFAGLVAARLNKGLIMIRKKGKLPGPTKESSYDLEYASATMEVQEDAISKGDRVLLIDDLLATGGTAIASEKLIQELGGTVIGHAFVIELEGLGGRERLKGRDILKLVTYEED